MEKSSLAEFYMETSCVPVKTIRAWIKSISHSRYQKAGRIDYEAWETKMDVPVCVQAVLPQPKG